MSHYPANHTMIIHILTLFLLSQSVFAFDTFLAVFTRADTNEDDFPPLPVKGRTPLEQALNRLALCQKYDRDEQPLTWWVVCQADLKTIKRHLVVRDRALARRSALRLRLQHKFGG